jgi:hypothetical protein
MTFNIRSHDGSITTNSVNIDVHTRTMQGSSIQRFTTKEGPVSVEYNWTATQES